MLDLNMSITIPVLSPTGSTVLVYGLVAAISAMLIYWVYQFIRSLLPF